MSRLLILLVLAAICVEARWKGSCSPLCDGCYGNGPNECKNCITHADWVEGVCQCNEGFSGPRCQHWQGECHDLCNGCNGPSEHDCKYCITNASKDAHGKCACNDEWSGAHCSVAVGSTKRSSSNTSCDPRCNGCTNSGADSCIECVKHAHFDSRGFCVCDDQWEGSYCQNYNQGANYNSTRHYANDSQVINYDMSDDEVRNEYYPSDYHSDDVYVNNYDNSHPNPNYGQSSYISNDQHYGNDHYYGDNNYNNDQGHGYDHHYQYDGYMGSGHYYGGIVGDCHPTCINGCSGPYASDCNECGEHSYWYEDCCACEEGYYHYDCAAAYDHSAGYYHGQCHGTCAGHCYGPDACDCDVCVQHAHVDYWGYCVCDDGYYGYDCSHYSLHGLYSGYCSPMCDGCYGPDDYDCMECPPNSYRDAYGYCCCNYGYYGDHCDLQHDQHQCHVRCEGGCSGSSPQDCYGCIRYSHMGPSGCECDDHWTGDDCSLYVYYNYDTFDGPCDPICNGCSGTDPTECDICVKNAHWDKTGRCVCDMFYKGDDCSIWDYSGQCAPTCSHCNGPDPKDCTSCVHNAVFNDRDQCECKPYFSGTHCEIQVYRGTCDSKCLGCKGPGPNECLSCVENAVLNVYGYCICQSYWSGVACDRWESGCDPKCRTCNGPLASDCDVCVPNAHLEQGSCVCDDTFAGESCQTYVGECFHTCDTCTGPDACDCNYCVANAHEDGEVCRCDDYWIGEGCTEYVGPCDPVCNGCYGPEACQCEHCVHHAHKNSHDDCECDDWWTGGDCSVFKGFCDDKCDGCFGPRACDCDKCVKNAYFDNHGYCVCEADYSGDYCLDYIGPCHGYCDQSLGCFGPMHKECYQCTENAHRGYDGFCVCDDNYAGEFCSEYTGECDPVCHGCHGPLASDCEKCVDNAEIEDGSCTCTSFWSGADCSYWTGTCFPTCHACVGPDNGDCYDCVPHANRSTTDEGYCTCDEDWSDASDCSLYNGECDTRCHPRLSCTSPDHRHCNECAENAHRDDITGGCVCNHGWSGENCNTYGGQCDPRCDFGCVGPLNTHCIQCVSNTQRVEGACVCLEGWDHIEDCSEYHQLCAPACNRCNGPKSEECYECAEHAKRSADTGLCTCEPHYSGDRCTEFDQEHCHVTCSACNGPSAYDCLDCIDNAHRDYKGRCVCKQDYGNTLCDYYSGKCHLRCAGGCSGPTDMHCSECVPHATLSDDGHCECDYGYTGEDCSIYQGACHDRCQGCVGPYATDCVICAANAYRVDGECQCMPGYEAELGTDNCMKAIIVCHVSCLKCVGTKQNECQTCHDGFFLSFHDQADHGFCLPCAEECRECVGFEHNECTGCYEGKTAHMGQCECCHASCETCNGIGAHDCETCRSGEARSSNGACMCPEGKVREPWTFACVDRCPFGHHSDEDGFCVYDVSLVSELTAIEGENFEDQGNGGLDFSESCHLPSIRDNFILDGKSTIGVKNFIPPKDFMVQFWVRAENIMTLFSLEMELWDEKEAFAEQAQTCQLANTIRRTKIKYDISLDSCHKAIVARWMDYKPAVAQNTQYDMSHHWAMVAVRVYSSNGQTELTMTHGSEMGDRSVITMTEEDLEIVYDINAKMYFGSLLGYAQKNEGRIDGIKIHTLGYILNDVDEICKPNCSLNQFLHDDLTCHACDESCTHGCTTSGACHECHETCAECSDHSPGSIDECTACYCGAELVNGRCQCKEDYYGPANNCQLKCAEGCQHCVGTGVNECYICEENYELLPATPGKCHWCAENECDEDGMPSCGTRGLISSECDCTAGQWYDGKFCRNCADGCASCNSIGVCEECEEGLYRFGAMDGCFDYCPFGFHANGDVCTPAKEHYDIFNFSFQPPEDGCQIFDYAGEDYNVRVFGGIDQEPGELEEPFIFEDRGVWFDGKYDLMTFVLLQMPSFLTYNFWTKVHSDGVLFAGNMAHESSQGGYYMGVNDGQVEFVGLRKPTRNITPLVVRTNSTVVDYFEWSYIQISLERQSDHDETLAHIYYNTKLELRTQFGPVYDFPEPKMTHTLGAAFQQSTYVKHFRGFLSATSVAYGLDNVHDSVAMECDGFCGICRGEDGRGECFGSCNWNHYWNWAEEKCQRCPLWCRQGCNTRGAC